MIAGLVELGRTEEAIELAGSEAASAQDLLGRLGEGIEEPVLVALLLGKTANARERGVTLRVEPGARLCAGFPPTELATIVGNLIDNALDALGPDREGTVTVAIDDDGPRDDRHPRRRPGPRAGGAPSALRARRDDEAAGPGRPRARPRARPPRRHRAAAGPSTVRNEDGAVLHRHAPARRRNRR